VSLLARFVLFSCLALGVGGLVYWYSWHESEQESAIERSQDLRLLALNDPTACMDTLVRLRANKQITPEELVLLVELSLEVPGFSPAKDALTELEELLPGSPEVWVLRANLQYHEGQVPGAIENLRAVLDDHKDDRRARFVMNKILWVRGTIEDRLRAKGGLLELGENGDEWGYKALRVLVFSRPGPGFLKHELVKGIEDLRTHPLVTSTDFLKACELDLMIEREGGRKDSIDKAMAAVRDPVEEEDLGHWLVGLNENEKALSLISQDSATRDASLFFIRFQALLQTKRIGDAGGLFETSKAVLSDEESLKASVYLAICRGDEKALEQFYVKASSLGSAESLLEASRLGLLAGMGNLVFKAFEQAWAIDRKAFGLDQANQFLQIALASGRTKLAHQITGNTRGRFPYKYGNLNNHCYLSLLIGEDPKNLEQEAERIVLAFPSNPSFLSTLALAKVLVGKPQEAFEAMRARGRSPMLHGERALMAVILAQVGKKEDARKLAKGLTAERMLPEEWALLQGVGELR
jgi:tetratricopeptide (TPR) repeat protein